MPGITIAEVEAAHAAIREQVRLTPVWPSVALSRICGVAVALKCEHLQVTGSFKVRGALNVVRQMDAQQRRRGLVAASAGNHAQGLAYAAQPHGADVVVVMPENAPLAKVTATREYGARVLLRGGSLDEARSAALAIAAREGRIYVPPFDDDAVIAGQGTLGLELLAQAPGMRELIVPAGGGGLLAGVALAVKSRRPEVRVVGVQTEAMPGIRASLDRGAEVHVEPQRTIADGVAVSGPSARTLALIERYVDDVVTVGEESVAQAILLLIEKAKFVVEGAGALPVAALQAGVYRPAGETVAVLSGGNIDINLLGSIVRRGLVEAGRYRHLAVAIPDVPGALAAVTRILAEQRANTLELDHDRESRATPVGVARVEFVLEVNGDEHFREVVQALQSAGYPLVAPGD